MNTDSTTFAATAPSAHPEASPNETGNVETNTRPLSGRLTRLALALGALFVIIYVLAPLPVQHFGPLKTFANAVDRTGIMPGALYYSDVEQTLEAERNNRNAIRYFVEEKKPAE